MSDDIGLDKEIKKNEKTSLKKFKNQNIILKKFGKVGLKVYRSVRKRGITIRELMEKTKVEQKELFEVLLYLKKKKMIETVEGGKKKTNPKAKHRAEKKKAKEKPKKKENVVPPVEEKIEPEIEKPKPKVPDTIAPAEEIAPEEEEKEEMAPAEEEVEIKPVSGGDELVGEDDILPDLEEEIAPEEEESRGEEIEEKVEPGEETENGKPETEEEEELIPLDLEEKTEEKTENGKPETEEEEELGAIMPERGKGKDEDDEEEEDIFLSPGEKKIKAKYGEVGIEVYNLIDGQRTAEEIMKDTGVTENTLIEMLDFMEKEGIIKLEHPDSRKPTAPKVGKSEKEVGFAPMLEETTTPAKPLGGKLGRAFTLDIPSKKGGNMLKEIQVKTNLMLKFKKRGVRAFELINGKRDEVEIALSAELPLFTVYRIVEILEKDGLVTTKHSSREEIKRKYGEDGYSVYKRYGREGVMLYQLIGKDMDLREMAHKTSEDKEKVVQIFMFIHKLLGIELPIDEDVLLERLQEPVGKK